jgi:AcrR family transcriptional regulator
MHSKSETTRKIIESAADLFLDRGFHNVSMDLVAETAHTTKVTIYQHFRSKEVLLLECMRWRLESREANLDAFFRGKAPSEAQVLEIFDWMAQRADKSKFRGCAFVKATNEVGATLTEVRTIAAEAKDTLRKRLLALLRSIGAQQPENMADTLALLLEGAQALSLIEQSVRPFQAARREASDLIAPLLTRHATAAQPAASMLAQKGS